MATQFRQLNDGWNAEPNAPERCDEMLECEADDWTIEE